MARDEQLLHEERWRPAALRLYGWRPATLSLGYFQAYAAVAELPAEVRHLPVVRRPTGGGAILHDDEVTYCLALDDAVPITRQSPIALYTLVHACWRDVIAASGITSALAPDALPLPRPRTGPFFCFEKPGRTDLLIGDRKVLGSAQRRLPGRVLQHGSLLLSQNYAAHPGADLGRPAAEQVAAWCEAFVARLARALELEPAPATWHADQYPAIEERRQVYASPTWTQRL